MKFTFKKEPKLSGIGSSRNTEIKIGGLVVGTIVGPHWGTKSNQWKVRFAVVKEPTKSEPAPFKWVTLATKFDDESEARAHLTEGAKSGKLDKMLEKIGTEFFQFPKDE